jgi:hypothetical protein
MSTLARVTWVVGMPGLLSRGVLVGDVRITLRDPSGRRPDRELEGVQKIHRLTDNIAVGFAGNIDTALGLILDAKRWMGIPEGVMPEQPSRYAFHWRRRLRWIWRNHLPERNRSGGVAFMWMGALPTQSPGLLGGTMAWILRSPDFEPERIPNRAARSIGSGAAVEAYANELYEIENDFPNIVQFEAGPWAAMGGSLLAFRIGLSEVIEAHATPGISPHLVLCSVQWGRVGFTTNDREGLSPGASSLQMPPIATTIDEWQAFKQQHGLANSLALA